MTTRTSIVGAALGTLIAVLRCGTSSYYYSSDAFPMAMPSVVGAACRRRHHRATTADATSTTRTTTTSTTTTTMMMTTSHHGGVRVPARRRSAVAVYVTSGGIGRATRPHSSSSSSSSFSRSYPQSSSSSTCLHMIAKSGGRPILSAEQFEREVLSSSSSSSSTGDGSNLARGDEDGGDARDAIDDGYDELPALVLFTAPWCGPCRLTSPVVGEILVQYRGRIRVLEMSTDDLPDVAMNAGVRSIPTILIYHGGEVRDTIVGCVARNVLARAVDKVLEDLGRL